MNKRSLTVPEGATTDSIELLNPKSGVDYIYIIRGMMLIVLLLFKISAFSQITISYESAQYQVGEQFFTQRSNDTLGLIKSGEDVVWDFYQKDFTPSSDYQIEAPNQATQSGNFPNATIVKKFNSLEEHFRFSDNTKRLVGLWIKNSSLERWTRYVNPSEGLTYPINYGDSGTFRFAAVDSIISDNQVGVYQRTGLVKETVDAFGSVRLKNGSVVETIRVRKITIDSLFTSTTPRSLFLSGVTYSYEWYSDDSSDPIATVYVFDNGSAPLVVVSSDSKVSSVKQRSNRSQDWIEVYPNPAKELINVNVKTSEKLLSFEIIDLVGQTVMAKDIHNSEVNIQINGSELPDGLYTLRFHTNKGVLQEKVIIRK
jgi:hypothetical protein